MEGGMPESLRMAFANEAEPSFAILPAALHRAAATSTHVTIEGATNLWRTARAGELSTRSACRCALPAPGEIELIPVSRLFDCSANLAIALDHAASDCVSVACCEHLGQPLVMADARLLCTLC
jgi:predicted nucleic acid-binding protein